MKHRQIEKQLSAYFDDALSPRERKRIELHLRTCDSCAQILADFARDRQMIAGLRQAAPPGIWEAVQEQMGTQSRVDGRVRSKFRFRPDFDRIWRRWIFRPVSAGVGVLVAVCLVLALLYLNPTQETRDDALDVYLMVYTEYATHNPLTSSTAIDSFFTVEQSEVRSTDTVFPDDTQIFLDAYWGD